MTSAESQLWRRLHNWADVIHADIFKRPYLVIYKTLTLTFQADPGMFSYQNRRGLNRPILRPLWLMTSAAADVISVPSVILAIKQLADKTFYNDLIILLLYISLEYNSADGH